MFYKVKGVSKKTGEGTVYVIYRNGSTETAKSCGVTVKPAHFNPATGKVSMRDGLHPEKNERIETVSKSFARACRDIESFGYSVTRATVDAAIEAETERKQELTQQYDKGWDVVAEREARIEALEAELKKLRGEDWGHKYVLEYNLPKQQRYERMIDDQQRRLATIDAEATEIRAHIAGMQEEIGLVSCALFKDKLNEFIKIQRLNHVKESTLGNYKVIEKQVDRYNPRLQMREMDLQFFQDFQAHLVSRGVTNNSIRGTISRIKSIYKYFADDLNLPTGFFSKFKQVKARKDENVLFLTPEELAELEALSLKPRVHNEVRAQFLFAVETGLRRSDYNITTANIKGREIVVTTQKTGKTVSIPATDRALQLFNEAGQNFRLIPESQFNQTLRLICQKMPSMQSESLKTLQVGSKVTQKSFKKWQRMTSHVARKTFVENAVAKGIELIAIAEWLGHSDTTMLTKHYANTKMIAKREAHKLLE
jgi:site-specific recombinase XerD